MMDWFGVTWSAQPWWWMGLMMLAWIGLFAVAAWALWWATSDRDDRIKVTESPRAILDRRLASGELDAEQYSQARRLLDASSVNQPFPTAR